MTDLVEGERISADYQGRFWAEGTFVRYGDDDYSGGRKVWARWDYTPFPIMGFMPERDCKRIGPPLQKFEGYNEKDWV